MKRIFRNLPKSARIVEVGPRDGLQNEKSLVPFNVKLELIDRLTAAGIQSIEAGSFVSPKWVPQMADTDELFRHLSHRKLNYSGRPVSYSALTPNLKGLEAAMRVGVKEIAVFGAASESFSNKNINCSIDESLHRFEEVCQQAISNNIKVRGYVSCVLGCPYEGSVQPEKVLYVTQRLLDLGCYEVSLGDTIGIGTPGSTARLLDVLVDKVSTDKLAVHFHDTYGQALSNILVALQYGINVIDSSVSGLGGCPYAKGASGNVATEDVVYMLQGLGVESNIDIDKLVDAAVFIDSFLGGRKSNSKYTLARLGQEKKTPVMSLKSAENTVESFSSSAQVRSTMLNSS